MIELRTYDCWRWNRSQSHWWTRTYEVGHAEKKWSMPFVAAFDVLGYRFDGTVKGIQGAAKSLRKGMGSR